MAPRPTPAPAHQRIVVARTEKRRVVVSAAGWGKVMSVQVVCRGCGKRFAVAEEKLRAKLPNCPACGQPLSPPSQAGRASLSNDSASTLDILLQGDPYASRPMPRTVIPLSLEHSSTSGFNWLPWAIGGGGLALVAMIGLISYALFRPVQQIETTSLKARGLASRRMVDKQTDDAETAASDDAPSEAVKLSSSSKPSDDAAAKPAVKPTASPAASPSGTAPTKPVPAASPSATGPKPPSAADTAAAKLAERKQKPREKMSVADLIDTVGDGVVHITVHDDDGEPFATGSGLIVAVHKVEEWIEPENKSGDREPWQGDLWLVATNYHVVAGSAKIMVRLRDGTPFEARGLAAISKERDLAVVALDRAPENLTILEPAAEGTFRQGEEVVAIGHPKGFDFTVSTGIISAIRGTKNLPQEIAEWIEAPEDQQWIQTTAAITNGNSGGPLLTMFGEVVGINTWIINSSGNLAFASHIKHMAELQKSSVEIAKDAVKIKTLSFAAAKPVEAPEKIGDKDNWLESEVREELARSTKRSRAINWRPATKGDYTTFQAVATMLTIAAIYRYDVVEWKEVNDTVRKRSWEFSRDVEAVNRYAVEYLEAKVGPVVLFGTVRRVNPVAPRKFWVDLTGRGHTVAVTVPTNQPAPKLEAGKEIALFGYCIGTAPENLQLNREVPHLLCGLIVEVKLPSVPEDTALQIAYDLSRNDRQDQGFEENVRKFVEVYPRAIPMIGKTAVRWQRIELNGRGRQFDAVRFSVPPELHADMICTFNDPNAAIEQWSIMPVANFPMYGDPHHYSLAGSTVLGLTKAESSLLHVDTVEGGLLVPNEDYLLWFAFKDAAPQKMAIAVRLVPTGSFDQGDKNRVGVAMRDGIAFKADELVRMTKALKEKSQVAAASAEKSDDHPEVKPPEKPAEKPAADPEPQSKSDAEAPPKSNE